MSGPERLEDDARPARRWTWVLVGVAVVVVVALAGVRLAGTAHDPVPPAPSSPPVDRTAPGWPAGLPAGSLYAVDGNGLAVLDTTDGSVRRPGPELRSFRTELTASGSGVLVWSPDGEDKTYLVDADLPGPFRVEGQLAAGRSFLPGDDVSVWTSSTGPDSSRDVATWRLVGSNLRTLRQLTLRGTVTGDGSGGLLETDVDGKIRHLRPGSPTTAWDGAVLAVGPDGFETLRCAGERCRLVLVDRTGRRETPAKGQLSSDLAMGALSPGSTRVATVDHLSDADDSPAVVRVLDTGTGRELRRFRVTQGVYAMTWLSDRWLAANSDHGLVLYDAVDDRLVSPHVDVVAVSKLVFRSVG